MKQFIEDKPAIVFALMILFGLGAFFVAGINLHVMMGMADIGSKQIFIMMGLCVVGSLFTVLPFTYLYDIIKDKQREINILHDRNSVQGSPRPRGRQEATHWQSDIDTDDDIDGDGQGDDSLRRLGVIR